jgi:hypothetical protein
MIKPQAAQPFGRRALEPLEGSQGQIQFGDPYNNYPSIRLPPKHPPLDSTPRFGRLLDLAHVNTIIISGSLILG